MLWACRTERQLVYIHTKAAQIRIIIHVELLTSNLANLDYRQGSISSLDLIQASVRSTYCWRQARAGRCFATSEVGTRGAVIRAGRRV